MLGNILSILFTQGRGAWIWSRVSSVSHVASSCSRARARRSSSLFLVLCEQQTLRRTSRWSLSPIPDLRPPHGACAPRRCVSLHSQLFVYTNVPQARMLMIEVQTRRIPLRYSTCSFQEDCCSYTPKLSNRTTGILPSGHTNTRSYSSSFPTCFLPLSLWCLQPPVSNLMNTFLIM